MKIPSGIRVCLYCSEPSLPGWLNLVTAEQRHSHEHTQDVGRREERDGHVEERWLMPGSGSVTLWEEEDGLVFLDDVSVREMVIGEGLEVLWSSAASVEKVCRLDMSMCVRFPTHACVSCRTGVLVRTRIHVYRTHVCSSQNKCVCILAHTFVRAHAEGGKVCADARRCRCPLLDRRGKG